MRILATNDDGILSDGLWALVRELKNIGEVVVVAPDREQSAIGTAVTLRQTLRVQKIRPPVAGVEAYSVEGTPSDSVILALGKLLQSKIDFVVSGVNQGLNLGEDVHISGTVGAALQGYLHGYPAMAISAPYGNSKLTSAAAKTAALLIERIAAHHLPANIFLNVNLPEVPLARINRAEITRLASESHINTIEEGDDGRKKYYWLVRHRGDKATASETDIWAIEQGNISISLLHSDHAAQPSLQVLNSLCADLVKKLKAGANGR